ncbi:hypothetical protein LSH36_25g02050, partial [Paralvinella palmiformis]
SVLLNRHDESEESTDGIDLSASCSFNLRERQTWKLALNKPKQNAVSTKSSTSTAGGVDNLQEEYFLALATNIVQELLYLWKQREKDETKEVSVATNPKKSSCDKHSASSRERKSNSKDSKAESSKQLHREQSATSTSSNVTTSSLKEHHLLQEVPDQVVYYVTQMISERENQKGRKGRNINDMQSGRNITLNIWDFAGQMAYYTTHQVFLSPRAVYLMVFNLSSDLDALVKEPLSSRADRTQVEYMDSELSHVDYMDFWLNSIHAHAAQNTRDSVDNTTLSPPIFIVGTHRGGLSDNPVLQEKLAEQKFDRIRQHLMGKPYERHIVPVFYAVENNITEGEDEQVLQLRRHIEEIHEVAKEAGIVSDCEFETLLGFYHDLGVIIYYGMSGVLDVVLQNTVILKPQWIIDMFKRIITAKVLKLQWQSIADLWEKLITHGILEESLLDVVWSDTITQKPALLGLLEKFDLIAEHRPHKVVNGKMSDRLMLSRSFYIPCRLQRSTECPDIFTAINHSIVFYVDFNGFLPDGLFHRVLTRALRWSQEFGGNEPRLCFRKARFFLDSEHDFILEMAPLACARIKVTILRLVDIDEVDMSSGESNEKFLSPPRPAACAKVRNFLESTLSDLRELWMKRISYQACVQCTCNKECNLHHQPGCTQEQCLHFLNLDECLTNKVVCCEHRRIKTTAYRKWFPTPRTLVFRGPVLSNNLILPSLISSADSPTRAKQSDLQLPLWVRSAAKLLSGGADGQDWLALAKRLEADHEPPQVFISYQWDSQDEVNSLRDRLEKSGYSCWMDIGQMGGGDQLYSRIDEGIRNSKVVIACLSPKYIVSHLCNKELSLADLLRKPIIPVMYEKIPWPPPGGMALMFSQLVYINMKGIGGHGGGGLHADMENKYQEILQRVSTHTVPRYHPQLELSPKSEMVKHYQSETSLRSDVYDEDEEAGESLFPYISDSSVSGRTTYTAGLHRSGTNPPQHDNSEVNPFHGNQVEQVHVTKCAVCTIL